VRPRIGKVAGLVIPIVLASSGCGGDGERKPDRQAIRETVASYVDALNRGDAAGVCAQLSPEGQGQFRNFSTKDAPDCQATVEEVRGKLVDIGRPRIGGIRVTGDQASAEISSTRPDFRSGMLLLRQGDDWKIAYPPGLALGAASTFDQPGQERRFEEPGRGFPKEEGGH
jgi:hypothetical protein